MSILNDQHYRHEYEQAMEQLRERALSGDRTAVFAAMELFFRLSHMRVELGQDVAGPCPQWLADAALIPINEFAEGQHDHLENAFGIRVKPMKAPTRANRLRDRLVYEAVEDLESIRRRRRFNNRRNDNKTDSFNKVGRRFHMSGKSVELAWTRYRDRLASGGKDIAHQLSDTFKRRHLQTS